MSKEFSPEFIEKVRDAYYRQPEKFQSIGNNVFIKGDSIEFAPRGRPGSNGSKKIGEAWFFVPPSMDGDLPGFPLWGKEAMLLIESHQDWLHEVPQIGEDEVLLSWSLFDTYETYRFCRCPFAETRLVKYDNRSGYSWYNDGEMAEDWILVGKFPQEPTWKNEDWFAKYGGFPGWEAKNDRKTKCHILFKGDKEDFEYVAKINSHRHRAHFEEDRDGFVTMTINDTPTAAEEKALAAAKFKKEEDGTWTGGDRKQGIDALASSGGVVTHSTYEWSVALKFNKDWFRPAQD